MLKRKTCREGQTNLNLYKQTYVDL